MKNKYLFVYGSLREPNNRFRIRGQIQGILLCFKKSRETLAGVVASENPEDKVIGEIIEVSKGVLRALDDWEGALYIRKLIFAKIGNFPKPIKVWCYFWDYTVMADMGWKESKRIESGDWFLRENNEI